MSSSDNSYYLTETLKSIQEKGSVSFYGKLRAYVYYKYGLELPKIIPVAKIYLNATNSSITISRWDFANFPKPNPTDVEAFYSNIFSKSENELPSSVNINDLICTRIFILAKVPERNDNKVSILTPETKSVETANIRVGDIVVDAVNSINKKLLIALEQGAFEIPITPDMEFSKPKEYIHSLPITKFNYSL